MIERILVATDGSPHAFAAVDFVARLPGCGEAELTLLEVVPPPPALSDDSALREFARAEHIVGGVSELRPALADNDLLEARRRLVERGAKRVRPVVRHGDPAEEILAHIAEHGIDLVALGSRGQGRLAGLLLGSVSQKVASLARCAVLIVRPPAAAGEPPATR